MRFQMFKGKLKTKLYVSSSSALEQIVCWFGHR